MSRVCEVPTPLRPEPRRLRRSRHRFRATAGMPNPERCAPRPGATVGKLVKIHASNPARVPEDFRFGERLGALSQGTSLSLSWPQPASLFPKLCARFSLPAALCAHGFVWVAHGHIEFRTGNTAIFADTGMKGGWAPACLASPLPPGPGSGSRKRGKNREAAGSAHGTADMKRERLSAPCAVPCEQGEPGDSLAGDVSSARSFSILSSHDPQGPWPRISLSWDSEIPVCAWARLPGATCPRPSRNSCGCPGIAKVTGEPPD